MMRHGRLGLLVAYFLSVFAAVAAAAPFAYIPNSGTGPISVIDVGTHSIVASVGGASSPLGIALTPDGAKAYVTDQGTGSLLVVDMATNGLIKTLPIGSMPFGVAVSADGSRAYVTRFLSAMATGPSVVMIDTASDTIAGTIAAGRFPMGVAVSADGKVYVAVANGLTVINGGSVTTRAAGIRPFGVAVNPVLKRVYVTNRDSDNVSVFDAVTDSWLQNIPVGDYPHGVAVSPNGKRVFVANHFGGTVTAINAETNGWIDDFPVGTNPYGLQVTPDGKYVYVANWGSNSVSVLNASTGAVVATVTLPATLPANARPIAFGNFITPQVIPEVVTVQIDIMPGGNPNTINLRLRGTLPVAILSQNGFDATSVDPATIKLAGAAVAMRGNGTPMASLEDVNDDGSLDLIVHVRREQIQLSPGDTVAVLEGKTYDGLVISGSDSVKVVP